MYEFTIPGISGGPDQNAIMSAVLALDGNATLDFNWATHKVSVNSTADLADISEMLAAIGYHVEKIAHRAQDDGHHHCDLCD
jgi:hypothetical protein